MRLPFFNNTKPMKREESDSTVDNTPKGGKYASHAVLVNNPQTALSVAAFHRAVELRAKTMSQLIWEYQKRDKSGRNFVQDASNPRSRKINYLLQVQPNPLLTWATFAQQCEIYKMCEGNAVIYIDRDHSGELNALWLAKSWTYNQTGNYYCVTFPTPSGDMTLSEVPASDILHIKNTFSINGGVTGISTLAYAEKVLSIAATNDEQTLDTSAKGGRVKLLVQEEKQNGYGLGRAAKKELEKITAKLNDEVHDNDVILLSNIAGVTNISTTAAQQELLESRKFSVKEIARLTGVPAFLLMDENSNYKSPEAATQEFLLRTISPAIREWENELNAKLIGPEGFGKLRFHLCEQSLMRLDPQGQANIDKLHLETGVMSVNELRAQYDLGIVEGGDVHYISTNLAEVGSKKLNGEETKKGEE